jgi:hypothetical protein
VSDKKLTVDEIKTALKHCSDARADCGHCILYDPKDDDCRCSSILKANALEYIKSLELEAQRKEVTTMTIEDLQALDSDLWMEIQNIREHKQAELHLYLKGLEEGADRMFMKIKEFLNQEVKKND